MILICVHLRNLRFQTPRLCASAVKKTVRLKLTGITKSFGPTRALAGVDIELQPGEIHALLGENGAGKSTLMKILSGVHAPDSGEIFLDATPFRPANPLHARRAGVSMIYQELTLARDLSVEENIMLGEEPHRFGWISKKECRDRALAALAELHSENIPLDARAGSLPIAQQQLVEIARALVTTPRVLIMDEPTSSLTQVDTQNLFTVIRKLARRGVSVIYISHFLEESAQLCNRYTVLRDGASVASGEMKSLDRASCIKLMVGRELAEIYPRVPHKIGVSVLEVREFSGRQKPRAATFTLREGEIFGIAGLVGAGRTELLRAMFGLDKVAGGEIFPSACNARRATPRGRLREGIGMVSENRKEEGLMLQQSLADNLTLTNFSGLGRFGFISQRKQKAATRTWMEKLSVKARTPSQLVAELSGGNQQKIAIGRLLHHGAKILLLDEPTRGIDVGSKAQIYQLIGQLAAEGKAVLFVSSYLAELLGICDTIGVMCRGVLAEIRPASQWTEHEIISAAVGEKAAQIS
jgi:ribose transport system ATP-binding protein